MPLIKDITSLFFPPVCPACGGHMPEGSKFVCNRCRWDIPLTGYWNEINNPVVRKFWGTLPVVNASAFFFFVDGSVFRELIHGFKYKGQWKDARDMGEWFGTELTGSGLYDDIDVVIPVPLHIRKKLRRGYNQSEYIAIGIAKRLGIPVNVKSVIRRVHNPSQTDRPHHERWENVKGIFAVRNPESLSGKHILLVDDVLTTGATITSCAETIVQRVPDCRISIATLAVSKSDLDAV